MKFRPQFLFFLAVSFALLAALFVVSAALADNRCPKDTAGQPGEMQSSLAKLFVTTAYACGGGAGPGGPTLPPAPTSPPSTPLPPVPPPVTGPPSCPSPQVFPGAITVSALKLAPAYPLVIGQDDTRRGADARWEITIEPTVYVTWRAVPEYDRECGPVGSGAANCTRSNGLPGRFRDVQTGWRCEASTAYYQEGVNFANLEAHLSQASRDWILTGELQRRYPGAYLHNPDMTFRGGNGWFAGNVFRFVYEQTRIPFADPGHWELTLSGQTSGTAVSPPRNFGGVGGTLSVYLREIAIIR